MITAIILSFFGLSCLASIVVFAACVASSRADEIQRGAYEELAMATRMAATHGELVSTPKLALSGTSA